MWRRGPAKEVTYFNPVPNAAPLDARPMTRTEQRLSKAARLPLWSRLVAGGVLVALLVVLPVSCVAQGMAYDACVAEKVKQAGFDQPNQAILAECR
jgi:hypothetical protein